MSDGIPDLLQGWNKNPNPNPSPPIKGCIPLKLVGPAEQQAAKLALIESMGNKPWPQIVEEMAGWQRNTPVRQEAVSLVGKTWKPGSTIGVYFMDGTPLQRDKCRHWAETWLEFANLHFGWDAVSPEIQVSFRPGMSYSLLGTDCLSVRHGPTLQLGWVTDQSDDVSDRAVILHEFGHAIGLGHEQSHPDHDIAWNKEAAEAYYRLNQGWDAHTVEANVFEVYSSSQVETTAYDRTSIMQYPVPDELTTDGRGIGFNSELSAYDKEHISTIYPGVWTPPAPSGAGPAPVVDLFPPPDVLVPMDLVGTITRATATAGQPARWAIQVVQPTRVKITVKIGDAFGQTPVMVGKSPDGPAFVIALKDMSAVLDFAPGQYELDLYHPMASSAVKAGAKAETVP